MKKIYKYPLKIRENQIIEASYVKILNVVNQGMMPTLYLLIDESLPKKALEVVVVGTGWELEDNIIKGEYIGTVTDGVFVWHTFVNEIIQ